MEVAVLGMELKRAGYTNRLGDRPVACSVVRIDTLSAPVVAGGIAIGWLYL
jgi:hypothetical protein